MTVTGTCQLIHREMSSRRIAEGCTQSETENVLFNDSTRKEVLITTITYCAEYLDINTSF
jgi:hypothetical protein